MSRQPPSPTKRGFTLIELVVATALASILIAGLTSTLFIAVEASSGDTPAPNTLEGLALLTDMTAELQYAVTITEQTAMAITVTVPDRNADTFNETIRYAWSGTPGDPLTRQYNGGTVANVADDVYDFDIRYRQPGTKVDYATVRLRITSIGQCSVQTAIPFVNRP